MGGMGSLPDGYRVSYCRYGPMLPGDPFVLTLSRTADDSVVADFVWEEREETLRAIRVAAWRDHRERTLRLVDGEGAGS